MGQLRFTFGVRSHTSNTYSGLIIRKIYSLGQDIWGASSILGEQGVPYRLTNTKTVYFLGDVSTGKGTSLDTVKSSLDSVKT